MTYKKLSYLILGDIMLDRYIFGKGTKLSPEAPVPVITVDSEKQCLGGAANVAANIAGLDNDAILCGTIGSDASGATLLNILPNFNVNSTNIQICTERPTTVKTRIIADRQQMLRIDKETTAKIHGIIETDLLKNLENLFKTKKLQGILISDYNKGVITQNVVNFLQQQNIPIFVDPKPANFHLYHNVTCLTPNRKEAEEITGIQIVSDNSLKQAGKIILEDTDVSILFITLGKDGIAVFTRENWFREPTISQTVFDVTGAGDTVLAIIAHCFIQNLPIHKIAKLANLGASYIIKQLGTSIITSQKLSL